MSKKYINTLDFYGYRENNRMEPATGSSYKVKVSDKDGNIITIEKDDSLYACVKLSFDADSGILSLLDAAHNDSVLAEVEMPNADYIYNCRFDKDLNAILFDVKSLYGSNTDTIELDVESLVELYEAGQGIDIGEKNEETGRKPISVKLAEGEDLLTLTDEGLGIDDSVVTEDELEAAISGKADTEYVDSLFDGLSGLTSGITDLAEAVEEHEEEIEKLKRIVGTEEEVPSLFEQIEDNREDIAEIDDEIGELSGIVGTFDERIDSISETVEAVSGDVETLKNALEEEIERATSAETDIRNELSEEAGRAISAETVLDEKIDSEIEGRKASSVAGVDYVPEEKVINFLNANNEIIDSIDASDFTKDGMIESVYTETVSGTTFLVIVWNTDAGKETTRINIGDLFEVDNYYTKDEIDEKVAALQEMDSELADADAQQLALINQNRVDMETADNQLWDAISSETANRRSADLDLWNALSDETNARLDSDQNILSQLNVEKQERQAKDDELEAAIEAEADERRNSIRETKEELEDKILEEKTRAMLAESGLQSQITAEVNRAQGEEQRIEGKLDDAVEELRGADSELRQYVNDQDATINRRIDGVVADLDFERTARQEKDAELEDEINNIRENYATIEYVDRQDENFKEAAINTSSAFAKSYTDTEIDSLEAQLKQYCDDEHDELREAISDNATKINAISNLRGVTGDDTSNYDDSGNGILDVLHREFHEYVDEHHGEGAIEEIIYEDGKLIIVYDTPEGEKRTEIPVSDLVDLTDYYKKWEVDRKIDDLVDGADSDYNTLGKTEGKIVDLLEKLGYDNNETLVTNNDREVAFGEYNLSNTGDDSSDKTIFSIGNGTDENNRSNALEVRENGDVYLWIEGEYMNINILLGMLSHETY